MIVGTNVTEEEFAKLEPGTLFFFSGFGTNRQLGMKAMFDGGQIASVSFTAGPSPQHRIPAMLSGTAIQGTVLAMPTAVFQPIVNPETMRNGTPEYDEAGAFSFVSNRRLLRCMRGMDAYDVDVQSGLVKTLNGPTRPKYWVTSWRLVLPNDDRSEFQTLLTWPLPP